MPAGAGGAGAAASAAVPASPASPAVPAVPAVPASPALSSRRAPSSSAADEEVVTSVQGQRMLELNKPQLDAFSVRTIPCFRISQMTGIGVGIVGGAAAFALTRSSMKAGNVAIGLYALSASGSWFMCRKDFSERRDKLNTAMRDINTRRGTTASPPPPPPPPPPASASASASAS